jgi:hypothetical protein
MLKWLMIFLLSSFIFAGNVRAQRYLVLDVSKPGGMKRVRMSVGDELCFKLKSDNKKYCGTILQMGDSMIYFKELIVPVNDIKVLYRNKSNFLTRKLSNFFLALGVGFVTLDTFNNAINSESPLVKKEAAIESGAFLVAGMLLKKIPVIRHKIGNRNSLKIIDISP